MKKQQNLILAVIFGASLALAAMQGHRVKQVRENEAFYRWILAAATNMRLGWEKSGEYLDDDLFAEVSEATEALLPDVPEPTAAQDAVVTKLSLVAGDRQYDYRLWDLVCSDALDASRERFLREAHDRKLLFAKDIEYAQAQESGVSVFNLFFGFRRVAANFVWISVDRYWHQGMEHRMIPLMKACVALDPNFVDAYLLGAWHLAYNLTAKMPDTPMALRTWNATYQTCVGDKEKYYYWGIDYLKDGIRNNPRDYRLYFDLGFAIYKIKLEDYPNAIKYLSEAIRQPHDRWVPRQLYLCQEANEDYASALAGWKDYLSRFPDNETATRFIPRNTALLYEQRAEKARKAAAAASEAQKAEELRAEAEQFKQAALKIWDELDEPYAHYRKLRIQAIEYSAQGRYMEAVGGLDKARWESPGHFDEISDLMMEIKQQGNLPFSVSEKKAMLRKEEGDDCPGKPANLN